MLVVCELTRRILLGTSKVSIGPLLVHNQHITVEVTRLSEVPSVLSEIYTFPNQVTRYDGECSASLTGSNQFTLAFRECFDDLNVIDLGYSGPILWFLSSDINATLSSGERSTSSTRHNQSTLAFRECFDDLNLIDLGYFDPIYTWKTGTRLNTSKAVVLSRCLCPPPIYSTL
ncbi:hypothetical protein V2J09_010521 [Rumex salicifolius]